MLLRLLSMHILPIHSNSFKHGINSYCPHHLLSQVLSVGILDKTVSTLTITHLPRDQNATVLVRRARKMAILTGEVSSEDMALHLLSMDGCMSSPLSFKGLMLSVRPLSLLNNRCCASDAHRDRVETDETDEIFFRKAS